MAASLGPVLPAVRVAQLGTGASIDRALVLPLCTVDEAGFPHAALLGAWEIVALDASSLRFAVAGSSRSAANLRRTAHATLLIVDHTAAHYVKLHVSERRAAMRAAPWSASFDARVADVLEDAAHPGREAGARLVTGIRCETDPAGDPARTALLAELRHP
jgi:hypothetical protein